MRDPYSLYSISWYNKKGQGHWFSWDQYQSLRANPSAASDALAYMSFGGQLEGRTTFFQLVSGNYFQMLGVGMAQGRPIVADDSGPVLVLSYDAWRNRFGADPAIVGRKLHLHGQPFEVVGVASPAFTGLE